MTGLIIKDPGPLATIQDTGRVGYSKLGVGRSGAVDRSSFALANRLVGNAPTAAALEVTMGGLSLVARRCLYVSLTGAATDARLDGFQQGHHTAFMIRPGQTLSLGVPVAGVRTYLAVRGGIAVDPVLGSRSTDTLAELGPVPLRAGMELPVGDLSGPFPATDFAPVFEPMSGDLTADFLWGPREFWFTSHALSTLCSTAWQVDTASNRVGVRLQGPVLERLRLEELPSEGVAVGSIQVPPSGPIVFLDDHPVTGGYPVVGVVRRASLDRIAQLRPGQSVRFRRPLESPTRQLKQLEGSRA
jgi:biotin-dependent carboxylase-like uncharacterized protein